MRFDAARWPGYPFRMVRRFILTALFLTTTLDLGVAEAQIVAFVATGESPSRAASRAVLRSFDICEADENVEVLESVELRRALAGFSPRQIQAEGSDNEGGGENSASRGDNEEREDPLADVRRLARRARGDRMSQSLTRLGSRVGVDLIVTIRQVGQELELRAFNPERSAFYRGTLMVLALEEPDEDELTEFILPRVAAVRTNAQGEDDTERPRRGRRNRWWIWVVIGGAVAAAAVIGVLVQPDEVENTGVTLRIEAP